MLGIFYSWPTRGKIIEDSMTNQFGEMKFLDSFERTVFVLSIITLLFSLPELPLFENIDALKIYLDPTENVSEVFWNYLSILYIPFQNYPRLYNLAWSFHFYFFGMGFFLSCHFMDCLDILFQEGSQFWEYLLLFLLGHFQKF